jgi:YVTN family beta-propeller protein
MPANTYNKALTAIAIMAVALAQGCGGRQDAEETADDGFSTTISREGVNVRFSLKPLGKDAEELTAGSWANVRFEVTDAETGDPIKGRYPAAWMDLAEAWQARGERPMACQDRVATYLQGIVGVRPMIDLNSHFLLVMNRDPSISVIDPAVGITGITNLFAQINLSRPGADWVLSEDHKRLFVSMPQAGKVAVVDTESFEVTHEIDAGEKPTRVEIQPDQRYLWVASDSSNAEESGVTVIDIADLEPVTFIETGVGHHEMVFTDNSRLAFVTNRDEGNVTVIDVQALAVARQIETGPLPIDMAYSPLSQAVYVPDGRTGSIAVIDTDSLDVRGHIETEAGLGPLRFERSGRWGFVVNPMQNKAFVIDASINRVAHSVDVGKQPYEVNFTTSFAYIRSLGTQDVGLIPLSELDELSTPPVTYIPAGQAPPGAAAEISIADSIIPAVKQGAAAYIVNQAEGTVSYYMEGMGAPMGTFRNYGHETRAIEIVDRSLSEQEPGVYRGTVKLPVEGTYDVAFMMDTPRFLHCFDANVSPDPAPADKSIKLALSFDATNRRMVAGESGTIRFRLTEANNGEPVVGIPDVTIL